MSEMIERVAKAIEAVQIFSRFNDWTYDRVEGLPIEICRYGEEGEDEIVILKRFPAEKGVDEALYGMVSEMRARAAIEAMREPTKEMVEPGYGAIHDCIDFYNYDSGAGYTIELFAAADVWRAMIDAALASPTQLEES